jgi:peptidoglycan/LPS O-acetylase OafA/YrhL
LLQSIPQPGLGLSGPPRIAATPRAINLEIEYLRAVAILLVVLLHASPFLNVGLLQYVGAHTGVDLFFCISGFVISRSFQSFFDQHRHDGKWWAAARAFWVRRIFRLVPSAWLWLLIAVGCSWAFNHTGWFNTFESNLKSAIFVVANIANFGFASGGLGGNAQYWSLALEDQFYLVFPFFLFFIRGPWRPLILIALVFVQAFPNRSLTEHPYLWATRLDALMLGCLISQYCGSEAYFNLEPKFCRHRIVALSIDAVLIFLLIAVPHLPHFIPYFRVESTVALASAGLVYLASFDRGYVLPVPRLLQVALAWIGSRSYGIYLIHIPLFGFIQDMGFRYSQSVTQGAPGAWYQVVYAFAAIGLLPILAELNFRFVESPIRRKGKQLGKQIMDRRATATRPRLTGAAVAEARYP